MTTATPTEQQLRVLKARCEEGGRKQAAHRLGLHVRTVAWHLAQMFERCGCTDDAQACLRHHDELERLPIR